MAASTSVALSKYCLSMAPSVIDATNFMRHSLNAYASWCTLWNTPTTLSTACSAVAIPILHALGGLAISGYAFCSTIPAAKKRYANAREHYNIVNQTPNKASNSALSYAKEEVTVAQLGLTNQRLFGLMGISMFGNGAAATMSPASATALGFTPIISAEIAAGAALGYGGAMVLFGAALLGSSIYHLRYLNEFEQKFHEQLSSGSLAMAVDNAVRMVEDLRKEDSSALERRIGNIAPLKEGATLEEKVQYLEDVDKGIYTQKLHQYLAAILGTVLFLVGIASIIALCVSTGGVALIGFAAAAISLLIVGVYVSRDSPQAFERLRDDRYTPSPQIQALKQRYELEQQQLDLQRRAASKDWWTLPEYALEAGNS